MKESKYYKKLKLKQKDQKHFKINTAFVNKFLISIIIVLSSLILTNFNSKIKSFYQDYLLEHNLPFYNINEIYQKYIGHLDKDNDNKTDNQDKETIDVANTNDLSNYPQEQQQNQTAINVGLDYPVTLLNSGIIVYIGNKDDLKNTIIVQGNDGVDIWYSNVSNTDYSLYDYVKKGQILGATSSENLLITIVKDGNYLKFNEYI